MHPFNWMLFFALSLTFFFFMKADGRILDYREGNTSISLLSLEKILGHSMQDILPPEVGPKFDHILRETVKTGKVVSIEYRLPAQEGERWFEARLVPFENEARVIAIVRDVSERVRNAERIQSQLRRLYALHSFDAAITASFNLKVTLSLFYGK
jgi:PAS domain S-box-containing protein